MLLTPPRLRVRHVPRREGEVSETVEGLVSYVAELDSFLSEFVTAVYNDTRSALLGSGLVQTGWGFVTFDGTATSMTTTVTLSRALSRVNAVLATIVGQRTDRDPTGPTDFTALADAQATVLAGTSSVTVQVKAPAAPAAGTRIGFTLVVVGDA